MITVGICVATYKRPQGLTKLLESILLQKFKKNKDIKIIIGISDNDIGASARDVANKFKNLNNKIIFNYGIESKRGIASNRNSSIKLVGKVDYVIFIDDDEEAEEYWLDELIDVQKNYNADVVTAPVISEFEEGIPDWIKKENFFYRYRFDTGHSLECAATGNTLVRYSVIKNFQGPFDENLGLMGGEDSILFTKIYNMNFKIVWCDTAIVKEFIPKSRCNINWYFKRELYIGVVQTRIRVMLNSKLIGTLKSLLRGIGLIVKGIILIPFSMLYGKGKFIYTLGNVSKGIGLILGCTGAVFKQYKIIEGK